MKDPQQKLFDRPAPAAYESNTSIAAAKAVTKSGRHASIQEHVLNVLKNHRTGYTILYGDGMTDEEIARPVMKATGCKYTSVVASRNSLCKKRPPLVEDSGRTRKSPTSGMPCTIWRIK